MRTQLHSVAQISAEKWRKNGTKMKNTKAEALASLRKVLIL
jgi:hypothetical protein